MKYLFKRLFAYIVDSFIISIIVSLFSFLPFLYNSLESSQNYSKEFNDEFKSDLDFITKYYDKKFDDLKDHDSSLSLYLSDKDNLSDEEYNDIMEKISFEVFDKSKKYTYNASKLQMPISILTFVISILYFVICPLILRNKTLGMLAMKMEYSGNLFFSNYVIRSLFLTGSLSFMMSSIALYNMDYLKFYFVYLGISIIKFIFNLVNLIMVISKKNHRGLIDLIAGTEIVGG